MQKNKPIKWIESFLKVLEIYCLSFSVKNRKLPMNSLDELSRSETYIPLVKFGSIQYTLFKGMSPLWIFIMSYLSQKNNHYNFVSIWAVIYVTMIPQFKLNLTPFERKRQTLSVMGTVAKDFENVLFIGKHIGLYARIWKRIEENKDQAMCTGRLCQERFEQYDNLVRICK